MATPRVWLERSESSRGNSSRGSTEPSRKPQIAPHAIEVLSQREGGLCAMGTALRNLASHPRSEANADSA
jgi:hypothetical protein